MPDNHSTTLPGKGAFLNRISAFCSAHPNSLFGLFSLLLALALYWDLLWQQQIIISDANGDLMQQFIAWRSFAVGEIHAGNFPFWNPYVFGGASYIGSMQSALFYPPNLLFLFLPIAPAVNWSVALHTWMLGFFAYLWLRHGRGLVPLSAAFGGLVIMFSAPFLMHIEAGHLPNISAMVWVPLILLAFDRWFAEGSLRWIIFGALGVAMQVFAGHPQYLFYTGITIVLLSGFKWLSGQFTLSRAVIGISAIYLLGCMVSAVQFLPGWETAQEGVRAVGVPFSYAAEFSLPLQALLTLIAPTVWDTPVEKLPIVWEANLYFSVTALALFFLGLNIRRCNDNLAYLLATMALFVLALGSNTPLFALLYHYVPGFDLFRGSAKFGFFVILIGIYFSATGTERLLYQPTSISAFAPGRLLAITIAVAGCAFWVARLTPVGEVAASGINPALIAPVDTAAALYRAAVLLGIAALLVWQAQKSRRVAVWGLMLLAVGEVIFFAWSHRPAFALRQLSESQTVEFLKIHRGDDRVLNLVLPDAGMLTHTPEVWGSDPGILRRWGEFMAATQKKAVPYSQFLTFDRLPPVLALTRLRWVIAKEHGQWQATEFSAPLPHVSLYHRIETITDKRQLLQRLTEPQFDFRQTLLLESQSPIQPVAGATGNVRIVGRDSDSLELKVELSAPAYLMITDAYSQGWHIRGVAESCGKDYQLMPVDHAFIGVPLEAGSHHLQLYYRPVLWWYGVSLSLLGILCLGLLWWWDRRKP